MKRKVSVVRFKFGCNIVISGKIIKVMAGSVATGTHCIPQVFAIKQILAIFLRYLFDVSKICFNQSLTFSLNYRFNPYLRPAHSEK